MEPLTVEEMDDYLAESRPIAAGLGVPDEQYPERVAQLRAWMAERIASGTVRVTATARSLSESVLYPSPFPPRFVWTAAHLISFSVLPAEILRAYGIPWNARRSRAMSRVASVTRAALPLLPGPLRYIPAWRSADRRLTPSKGQTA